MTTNLFPNWLPWIFGRGHPRHSGDVIPICSPHASHKKFVRFCSKYLTSIGWKVEEGANGGDIAVRRPGNVFHLVCAVADIRESEMLIQNCLEIKYMIPIPLVIVSLVPATPGYIHRVRERGLNILHYSELTNLGGVAEPKK